LGIPLRVGLSAVARYFAAIPNAEKRCAILHPLEADVIFFGALCLWLKQV